MQDVITYINEKLVAILWSLMPVLSEWLVQLGRLARAALIH